MSPSALPGPPAFASTDSRLLARSPAEFWLLTLDNALDYGFYDPQDETRHSSYREALELLRNEGCVNATTAWIENHWPLILWKLVSVIRSRPQLFTDGTLWTWSEVIRQLKYRCVPPFLS